MSIPVAQAVASNQGIQASDPDDRLVAVSATTLRSTYVPLDPPNRALVDPGSRKSNRYVRLVGGSMPIPRD